MESFYLHSLFFLRRQNPYPRTKKIVLIFADSAFGGIGIYLLRRVLEMGAHYYSPNIAWDHLKMCEHVVFNSFFLDFLSLLVGL